jgi:pSer/pThr/pTyr-binding forkhead associated (FHA) protein
MSGIEDGNTYEVRSEYDGHVDGSYWTLSIGRREDNDICLNYDTFISRRHGYLHWRQDSWWLEDDDSTNGTFIENHEDFFNDKEVKGTVQIEEGQLFKVGKTWMRIQAMDTYGKNTSQGHSD